MKQTTVNTLFFLPLLVACTNLTTPTETAQTQSISSPSVAGEYVSEGYQQREQGYDWVAVTVSASAAEKSAMNIHIHARDTVKKPTCELHTVATPATTAGKYLAHVDGTQIVFDFTAGALRISAGENSTHYDLMYYCSGGASIAGDYQRLPRD